MLVTMLVTGFRPHHCSLTLQEHIAHLLKTQCMLLLWISAYFRSRGQLSRPGRRGSALGPGLSAEGEEGGSPRTVRCHPCSTCSAMPFQGRTRTLRAWHDTPSPRNVPLTSPSAVPSSGTWGHSSP